MNLLKRLHDLNLELLAPPSESHDIEGRYGGTEIDTTLYQARLQQIRGLRKGDGKWYENRLTSHDSLNDERDEASWHLLGVDQTTDEVLGCIRMRVYDENDQTNFLQQFLDYCDVRFENDDVEAQAREVLEHHLQEKLKDCGLYYQMGGFVVSPKRRNTILPALLTLGSVAWGMRRGLESGASVATCERGVAEFNQRFGARPFEGEGGPLKPFFCRHHQALSQLLRMDIGRHETRLQETLDGLLERFDRTPVLLAG